MNLFIHKEFTDASAITIATSLGHKKVKPELTETREKGTGGEEKRFLSFIAPNRVKRNGLEIFQEETEVEA